MSPSAEVQGHSPEQRVTVGRKRNVKIKELDARSATTPCASCSTTATTPGLFAWSYLQTLDAETREALGRIPARR